ncbi:SH3 domain-containing protein [Anabaena sp. CS-542/02]|uniref:SH3 domain-containing protein n=1 Tax=Anabaena sp. CS-542/02 TaxID=3021719 RepID=UPI00232EC816|nr:SH3 domain-containing protein [Anabaena sp. CS-542/02]MDB9446173.1 SH3 domain-containing protein [Anabaena sp. CS-542/02]
MLSNLLKLILGFVMAIAILIGSGVTVAFYFINRNLIPPPKPIFANDGTSLPQEAPQTTEVNIISTPEPTPTETPPETPTETLPPGAYRGRVTWTEGLSVRAEPTLDAPRVAGVGVNEELIILEESQDKRWQKIRTQSQQEGWVRIGNTERID